MRRLLIRVDAPASRQQGRSSIVVWRTLDGLWRGRRGLIGGSHIGGGEDGGCLGVVQRGERGLARKGMTHVRKGQAVKAGGTRRGKVRWRAGGKVLVEWMVAIKGREISIKIGWRSKAVLLTSDFIDGKREACTLVVRSLHRRIVVVVRIEVERIGLIVGRSVRKHHIKRAMEGRIEVGLLLFDHVCVVEEVLIGVRNVVLTQVVLVILVESMVKSVDLLRCSMNEDRI